MNEIFKNSIIYSGWKNIAFAALLIAACFFTYKIYDLLNHGPYVLFLRSPLDKIIPLVKPFVIPYISLNPYVYLTLVILLVFNARIFESGALSIISAFIVSYIFYYFLQSYVERPPVSGNDIFSNLIRAVYEGDNPYNCFPSLHTSISTIMALHWMRLNSKPGIIACAWSMLIILSTLFIRQHYIADVAAGIILGAGFSALFLRLFTA